MTDESSETGPAPPSPAVSATLTRSQAVGTVALLAGITGWVAVAALHSGPPPAAPGILVRAATGAPRGAASTPDSPLPAAGPAPAAADSAETVIHVAGAVRRPGLYRLPPGARNDAAVKAAGGFSSAANPDSVNLAARAEDGSQLYVRSRTEQPSGGAYGDASGLASPAMPASDVHASAKRSSKSSNRSSGSRKLSDPSQGRVDLNTASAAELERLPGIGPATAQNILAYRRANGRFRSTEDLLQIPRFGDKKFQSVKAYVMVR